MPLNPSTNEYLNNSSDQLAPQSFQSSILNKSFHHLPASGNARIENKGLQNAPGSNQNLIQQSLSRAGSGIFAYMTQSLKDSEVDGSLKVSHYLQHELRKLANEGELIVPKSQFYSIINDDISKKFNKNTDEIISKAEEAGILHTTIRKFMNADPLHFVGLHLDNITIESLGWILKSIKNDEMTPTEKLILSRIKECFALKADQKIWKTLINLLLSYQSNGKKLPLGDSAAIPQLLVKKVTEPALGTETFVIYLKDEEWQPADQGTADESSELWRSFIRFIEEFFKEEDEGSDEQPIIGANTSGQQQQPVEGQKKPVTSWSSSVENVLNRSTSKKEKNLKIAKDIKAIPGGRYGCAQFIKTCGPDCLRKESLGKLNMLVQEAINKGILRYQRTLLVKNNQTGSFSFDGKHGESFDPANTSGAYNLNNSSFMNESTQEKRTQLLQQTKEALLELLVENPGGLSLAQIPQHT